MGKDESRQLEVFRGTSKHLNRPLITYAKSISSQVVRLVHTLSLLPVFPITEIELVPSIARIVNDILKCPPEETGFSSTARNITAALAECLVALSRLPSVQREADVIDYSSWLDVITLKWSWNAAVMEALLVLSSARFADSSVVLGSY
jgi:hypothetical protein